MAWQSRTTWAGSGAATGDRGSGLNPSTYPPSGLLLSSALHSAASPLLLLLLLAKAQLADEHKIKKRSESRINGLAWLFPPLWAAILGCGKTRTPGSG
jgi:hypothetical protein